MIFKFYRKNKISSKIQCIVEHIIQKYNPLKIILFGYAFREDYDVDIAVKELSGDSWKAWKPAYPE